MPASVQLPESTAMATKLCLRAGAEVPFNRWLARLTHTVGGFPGFLSVEMLPLRAGSSEWRVVHQFRSA